MLFGHGEDRVSLPVKMNVLDGNALCNEEDI